MSSTVNNKTSLINSQKLDVLLNVTKAINFNQSTEELLNTYEKFLRENLRIEKLILYSNQNNEWTHLISYGISPKTKNINIEKSLLPLKEITSLISTSNPELKSFDIAIPVYHKSQPLAYLLIGDIYDKETEISPTIKHLPFIQTLTNIILVAIENKRFAKERIRQEGMKKELELASQMQSLLFPANLPNDDKIEAAALYQPHQEVGGDYYDFIRLNENEVVFCMADVSGKGISAALLMSNFQANLRALLNAKISLTDLIKDLNLKVMSNTKGEKFITLFVAKYNQVTRVMQFINAGHNPPVLISGDQIVLLQTGSAGLGMVDELPKVKEGIINIAPNTCLFCYTDGVVELENEVGDDFGIERLKDLLKDVSNKSMEQVNLSIIKKLDEFKASMHYCDDVALLSCRFY
ncbi:MAG: PP2C family protein-serine/threonine phosphatase [Bacteroidetes bacterium]|nr:PP2C family protein-serine/threonine phosphatase [Bacteroidota bacterium]HET6245761.1 PP2C family protein-serine/threonine phosphatase [Bacteroidia bacterium]